MIARADRLLDYRLAFGKQSGKQHARFHLRARHFRPVVNRLQRTAVNFERRPSAFARFEIFAPISESGFIMRAIGRRESDSSPHNSLVNGWPARIPLNMRMVEPELPQSSTSAGAFSRGPTPCTSIAPSSSQVASTRSRAWPRNRACSGNRARRKNSGNGSCPPQSPPAWRSGARWTCRRECERLRRTARAGRTIDRSRIVRHEFNITEIPGARITLLAR